MYRKIVYKHINSEVPVPGQASWKPRHPNCGGRTASRNGLEGELRTAKREADCQHNGTLTERVRLRL